MSIQRARSLQKAMVPSEAAMWSALRQLKPFGLHFRRQVPVGRYYCDFACHHPKLVVEVDGQSHIRPDYDAARDAFIQAEGYRVLRVTNEDVLHNIDGVIRLVMSVTGRE